MRGPTVGWTGLEAYLLDQVQAAVIATDPSGTITHWNRHAEVLFGWTREEALGRDVRDLLVPEPADGRPDHVLGPLAPGETWEGDLPVRRKDGTVVLCHVSNAPILGSHGAPIGMVGVSVDVTERVRSARRQAARTAATLALAAAESLEEATQRLLGAICESLGWKFAAVWGVDERAGVLRCLDAWQAPGAGLGEFEAATRRTAFPPGVGLPGRIWATRSPAWIRDVAEDDNFPRGPLAAAQGLHGAFGFPILLGGELLGVIEFFNTQIEEPDGGLLEMMSVIGSQVGQFMERKEAEAALRESEARKAAILEAALDCVVTMDHRGNAVEFNPAAERTFGYRHDEVVGRPVADLIIPPDLRERHRRGLARYLATGEAAILGRRLEVTAMRSDGSVFPVELAVTRVNVPGPPLFTAHLRDITSRKAMQDELRHSRDQLEAIFQGVTEGITVQDRSGRIVYANEAAARTLGSPSVQELLDTSVQEVMDRFEVLDEAGDPLPVDRLPGRLALRGEGPAEAVVRFRKVSDGEERWALVKASPLAGEDGTVRFAINIFHDITERQRAQEAQRFVAEASAVLASSLDLDEVLTRLARLAVPRLADWCVVSLLEDDGSVREVAVAHADPERVRLADDLRRRFPPDPRAARGVPHVLRTGRSELYPEVSPSLLAEGARDQEHLEALQSLGLRSVMVVPLVARDRTVGAITFVSGESGRRFGPSDLAVAEDLGRRAGLAVDNARLFRQRTAAAEALQRSLLPPHLPAIPGVELAARYHPAGMHSEVGGDFYDAFPTGDRTWALVIGDVCGKGPAAAAVTGLARHTIRAAAIQERRPSRVLSTLNDAVIQQGTDHTFCTVCYVRIRRHGRGVRATVCCGGHPLPMVLRAGGRVEAAGSPGTLLGIFPDPVLLDRVVDLGPGDALVLFTDGVIEERGDRGVFGRDRLASVLAGAAGQDAAALVERVERAVLDFRPEPPRDDVAILVMRVRP